MLNHILAITMWIYIALGIAAMVEEWQRDKEREMSHLKTVISGSGVKDGKVSMATGVTKALTAQAIDESYVPSTPAAGTTWKSYNPNVARVDASGVVTSITPGQAIIEVATPRGAADKIYTEIIVNVTA